MKPFTVNQNIEIDGINLGIKPERKESKFYNSGKWNNFIKPLLLNGRTFIDIGSNAGLFLQYAKDYGFNKVIGVEKNKTHYNYSKKYRDNIGYNYDILNIKIGENFNFNELPVADFVLLSNVHYYFKINEWLNFIDKLQYKTRYCIIVSRKDNKNKHWMASADQKDILNYFKDWEHIKTIDNIDAEGDLSPRPLFAMLFKSKLDIMRIDKIYSMRNPNGVSLDKKLLEDIKVNGLIKPLIVDKSGKLLDGGHRLIILKELKYKEVPVRII